MKRKLPERSHYKGILAEQPSIFEFALESLDADTPRPVWMAQGRPPELWPVALRQARQRQFNELCERISALFAHFKIDRQVVPTAPSRIPATQAESFSWLMGSLAQSAAWKDLALALVRQHEPDLFQSGQVYGTLCKRYRLESNDRIFDAKLALALAIQYVPRFQLPAPAATPEARWTTEEIIDLFMVRAHVVDHLRRSGKAASAHEVARLLLNESELEQVVPKPVARALHETFRRRANMKRGSPGSFSNSALRKYLAQMGTAEEKVRLGQGNNFQQQLIFEVLPALRQLIANSE
jgi:hypothetical protein